MEIGRQRAEASVATTKIENSGIKIPCVRISNFRALHDVEIELNDLTVMVGPNNAGKTSILDGIQAAIGATRKMLGKDDIYLTELENDVPKDRKATIDILIRPVDDQGALTDTFPVGSYWTNLWGSGISQDPTDFFDLVAIRTTLAWNALYGDYRTSRVFLKEWKPRADWLSADEKGSVTATQIEPIAMHYIDAKRDLDEDLRSRGSFFRRLTDDLGLTEGDIESFEKSLTELNQEMIAKSEVLKHLRDTLLKLQDVISAEKANVDIAPIPRRLRDLSKGIDVTLGTTGAQSFPLNRHGMGTRSLASLLVFRAFASWRTEKAKAADDGLHSFLALEEPEAHLHPQAQRALFSQVKVIPGQRIVSTHSPYFAGQASLEDLRLLTKAGGETAVSKLNMSKVGSDDRRKLEREVVASRGDLLFARALILFEGETEEQAFQLLAQARFGMSVHEMGFSFVGVGGGNYYPFVWLATSFTIPWYILSDGEPRPVANLKKELRRAGHADVTLCPTISILPNGNDYEKQLLDEGYLDAVEVAIDKTYGGNKLDKVITELHGKEGKTVDGKQQTRDYKSSGGRERAALDFLRSNKTRLAAPVAQAICDLADESRRTPKCLKKLFDRLASDFGV
ncbi:MAG: ATP-dependent endonuclease of the family-like protein [Bradyrhizobium sp.]|nr:ATP-dependent endonuclease of the family-like protein [Bradyrhizobium sp.]